MSMCGDTVLADSQIDLLAGTAAALRLLTHYRFVPERKTTADDSKMRCLFITAFTELQTANTQQSAHRFAYRQSSINWGRCAAQPMRVDSHHVPVSS